MIIMASKSGTILALGAGALLLLAKKKNVRRLSKDDGAASEHEGLGSAGLGLNLDEADEVAVDEPSSAAEESFSDRFLAPDGAAHLGGMYQIKSGDTPLEVCYEALFGTRNPPSDPGILEAAMDLLVRIDCGPFNQAVYGESLSNLREDHARINENWSKLGVSFKPIYSDNLSRVSGGLSFSGKPGNSFALIWIPMINLPEFDRTGIVTTEGAYHPDTERGLGGSTIDPPQEILDFGLDNPRVMIAGCNLPEGDYRREIVQA